MAKIQQFSELTPNIPFTEYNFYDLYRQSFESSELGRIKRLLPLDRMAENLGLYCCKRGRKSYFSPKGKVALMFLKMKTGLSCPKLLEALNCNIHYQLFCDIVINPMSPLTNYKLLDDIISEMSVGLKIQQLQDILAEAWKPYMTNLDTLYTDATCYESQMRFPTDQKLLWECIEKSYVILCHFCSSIGIHRPRTKYLDVEKSNMAYVKQRKHTKVQTRKIIRRELNLLSKILKEIRRIRRENEGSSMMSAHNCNLLGIITKIYRQQRNHFESNDPRESIKDRIVSIHKPYVRPIVRGKEVRNVEFGAKCNNIQVDGLSFIEKLSFNAFNEGTRLVHCIRMHKRLFGVDVRKIGGDAGYAGNENRNYCKQHDIQTSFVKRGKPSKVQTEKDVVRQELARVRATAMEGSFGTQKEHYDLRKIKARRKKTEILYIFFGIHTANVIQLAGRLEDTESVQVA